MELEKAVVAHEMAMPTYLELFIFNCGAGLKPAVVVIKRVINQSVSGYNELSSQLGHIWHSLRTVWF